MLFFAESGLDGVETDAEDAHHVRDGDECAVVDGFDGFVDGLGFAFAGDEEYRFGVLFGEPADGFEQGCAAAVFVNDGVTDFAVFVGEDEHLDRLAAAVANGVERVGRNAHKDEAVGDFFDAAVGQQDGRSDDAGIKYEVDAAPADVFVF